MSIKFANGDFVVQRGSIIQVFNLWGYPRLCVVTGFSGNAVSLEPLYRMSCDPVVAHRAFNVLANDLFLQ